MYVCMHACMYLSEYAWMYACTGAIGPACLVRSSMHRAPPPRTYLAGQTDGRGEQGQQQVQTTQRLSLVNIKEEQRRRCVSRWTDRPGDSPSGENRGNHSHERRIEGEVILGRDKGEGGVVVVGEICVL
jgi:hypothetical protein